LVPQADRRYKVLADVKRRMTINEQDTDPSTPAALRTPEPAAAADTEISSPIPQRARTDPGIGPPSHPPTSGARPMSVVVPPPVALPAVTAVDDVSRKKDSVEILLDGMNNHPRPDRTRTMPQTDGEASAAYHAEHGVRAAHTSPDEDAKVVVEPSLSNVPTPALGFKLRGKADGLRRPAAAVAPTLATPPALLPRAALAVVAGLLVVVGLFVFLRFSSPSQPPPAAPVMPTVAPAVPVQLSSPAISAAVAAGLTETGATDVPSAAPAVHAPAMPTPVAPKTTRSRPSAIPAKPVSSGLGEFKTTF
jgi:hypothetical protein